MRADGRYLLLGSVIDGRDRLLSTVTVPGSILIEGQSRESSFSGVGAWERISWATRPLRKLSIFPTIQFTL